MEIENLILVRQFCVSHEIEVSFVESLHEYGLVEIMLVEKEPYIHKEKLTDLEKMIRLHYELDINMEGLDVIAELLNKIQTLQQERNTLKNKLNFYENQ